MTDGATTTPDTILVRLGACVAHLAPGARPGWWRIDPATCVRRAEEIEIRAAVLAAAASGGGSRLLSVLRAATLDGVSTPLADAVMLALALGDTEKLGDTENHPLPTQPEDGWTRVRFGQAVEMSPTETDGEDIAEWIEVMLARLTSQASGEPAGQSVSEPRPAMAAPDLSHSEPSQEHQQNARATSPEERTGPVAGRSSPVAPTRLAGPRARNPDQPDASAPYASTNHATLRHRRLIPQTAHARSVNDQPSYSNTAWIAPPGSREPAVSTMGATPAPTNQPDKSFQTIISEPPGMASVGRSKLAPIPKQRDQAPWKVAPASPSLAPWPSFSDPRPDNPSAPQSGHGSTSLDAPPPLLSWPRQTASGQAPSLLTGQAPVPALADADALLSIIARALADECDHRGLDR